MFSRVFVALENMQHSLNSLAAEACESKREILSGQGIAIKAELEEEENMPELFLNKSEIDHVLQNLILNGADSFGPEQSLKQITLKTSHNNSHVELSVIDTGKGIRKKDWKSIFNPGNTSKGSDGLGLALAKEAVSRNEGRIWVDDSRPGEGTTFKIAFEV